MFPAARAYGAAGMETPDRKLQVSLRLKAARWLAGARNSKGAAAPMSIEKLAATPDLHENGITKNRLEDIEQMKVDARPMELERIGQALGVNLDDLKRAPAVSDAAAEMLSQVLGQLEAMRLETAARVVEVLKRLDEGQGPSGQARDQQQP